MGILLKLFKVYTNDDIVKMMSNIKITKESMKKYESQVKFKRFEDRRTKECKLKRNYLIGKDIRIEGNKTIVQYGNLKIVSENNTIIDVENLTGVKVKLRVNEKLRNRINDIYFL